MRLPQDPGPMRCELAKVSILSVSRSGLAQVSNVGDIQITCRIPARPFPTTPGSEPRYGLKAATTAYEILADGSKTLVPSEVHLFGIGGGGFGPDPEPEYVEFYVHIPLDSDELDAEVRRYLARLEGSMTPERKGQFTQAAHKKALENLRKLVFQHRVGHFQGIAVSWTVPASTRPGPSLAAPLGTAYNSLVSKCLWRIV